jgi:hypothetical protein
MPAVLKHEMWPVWLGEEPATVRDLKAMLASYPSDGMICWPVSTRVGNVKNNDPSLIEPIAAARSLKSCGNPTSGCGRSGRRAVCYSGRSDPPNADRPFLKTPVFPRRGFLLR